MHTGFECTGSICGGASGEHVVSRELWAGGGPGLGGHGRSSFSCWGSRVRVYVCMSVCMCMCTRVCSHAHALAGHASVPEETDARGLSPRQVHC